VALVEPERLIEREVFHAERSHAFDRKRGFNLSPIDRTHSHQALADIAERRRHERELDEVRRKLVRRLHEKNLGPKEFAREIILLENALADPDCAEVAAAWDRLADDCKRRLVQIVQDSLTTKATSDEFDERGK
jgi:hypothetical protein